MERGHAGALRAAGTAMGRFDGRTIAADHPELPTAVVLTTRDRVVRPERQRDLAEAWRAEVVEVEGDHDIPIARPTAFADAITRAIDVVSVRGTSHSGTALAST